MASISKRTRHARFLPSGALVLYVHADDLPCNPLPLSYPAGFPPEHIFCAAFDKDMVDYVAALTPDQLHALLSDSRHIDADPAHLATWSNGILDAELIQRFTNFARGQHFD
jgi:hypothetical protein